MEHCEIDEFTDHYEITREWADGMSRDRLIMLRRESFDRAAKCDWGDYWENHMRWNSMGMALQDQIERKSRPLVRSSIIIGQADGTWIDLNGYQVSPKVRDGIDRREIFRRTSGRCFYCGWKIREGKEFHVDHVVPRSKGGTNAPANLVASCVRCNATKQDKDAESLRELLPNGSFYGECL